MPKPFITPDAAKARLCQILTPFLEKRYPGCPLNVHPANVLEFGSPKVPGAGIVWTAWVWVHGLPLRVSSWTPLRDVVLARAHVFKVEGDHGGTPGFADLSPA